MAFYLRQRKPVLCDGRSAWAHKLHNACCLTSVPQNVRSGDPLGVHLAAVMLAFIHPGCYTTPGVTVWLIASLDLDPSSQLSFSPARPSWPVLVGTWELSSADLAASEVYMLQLCHLAVLGSEGH